MPYEIPVIQGWMADDCMTWLYDTAQTMTSVVEVGSWRGRSTHALLSGCPGPVFAVDHFKGNPYELDGPHKDAVTQDIFSQFWGNVGQFPNLVVFRMPSVEAAQYFAPRSVDMVFIDGDHRRDAVTADIEAWRPACRKLICGHDSGLDTVRSALHGLACELVEVPNLGIWRIDI